MAHRTGKLALVRARSGRARAGLLALAALALVTLPLAAARSAAGAEPPPLIVVGATETGLTIPSSGAQLHSGITIATADKRARNVVARVTPLLDSATGERHQVAKPRTRVGNMSANSTAFIPLDAKLPYSGTFIATLSLSHDGVSDPPVPITVIRSLATSGVTVDSVQVSASSVTGLGGTTEVTRALVLNETAGRNAVLAAPVLVAPSSQTGNTMLGESGAMVTDTSVFPDQAGCRAEDGLIEVDAGRSCRLEVTMALPKAPGQYEGTLRFSQPGAQPLDTGMTIQMRLAPAAAILVILIGLGLGYLINEVLRNRRSRLDRATKAVQLGAELDRLSSSLPDGLRDAAERRAREDLRVLLAGVAADDSDAQQADVRLSVIGQQVASFVPWVNLRRAVQVAPEPLREPLLREVDEVGASLVSGQLTAADAQGLPEAIRQVAGKLRARQCGLVRNEIGRARAQLADWFGDDVRGPIEAQLDRAASFVADDAGTPELARAELEVAQQLAARSMRDRLVTLLEAPSPSFGMDPAGWGRLQDEVRQTLAGVDDASPQAALAAVNAADRTIVRTLANAADAEVGRLLAATATGGAAASQHIQQQRKPELEAIRADLGATRTALASGDLVAAHSALDAAHERIRQAKTSGFLTGQAKVVYVPELTPAPPQLPAALAPTPDLTSAGLPAAADIARQKRVDSWLLLICTLIVGVAVGLLALYAGKPTWGSLGDILLALLWGAGLWQASGAIQQGFAGVRGALLR